MYPIGNTPAVNLLRDIAGSSGEEESIRILCLACGDPRNILFSLWSEQRQDANRRYHFTCCDLEPAILARNVVLLTLIAENQLRSTVGNTNNQNTWNLFYHMLIPATDLEILREHCAKLLSASESSEAWLASTYGKFLQFSNRDTLKELRQYWTQYRDFDVAGKAAAELRDGLSQNSKRIGQNNVLNGFRSAGVCWPNAIAAVGQIFRKYWETGVAAGNTDDRKSLGNGGKGSPNPMFAISSAPSGKFAVHYGTEPLVSFHLAETFRRVGADNLDQVTLNDRLVQAAKDQFCQWCQVFGNAVNAQRVCIQLFFGEALNFCHELQLELTCGGQTHARVYTRPWSVQPLRLDGNVCPSDSLWIFLDYFDVIDTSNLGDHVGLINMVAATAPLLRPQPTSLLYTESLLTVSNDTTMTLPAALGSDVATFSILIGLAPSGIMSGITLEGVGNEATLQKLTSQTESNMRQGQYRLRVYWRAQDPTAQVNVDPYQLAAWFLAIYKKMFANEDMSTLFSRLTRMQTTHYSTDMPRYTRAALVALLRVVRTRTLTDWDRMMDKFLDLVETDRTLLVGSNSLQELNVHLALFGVWTLPVLANGPRQVERQFNLPLRPKNSESGVLGQANLPPIIYVVLSVPRKSLRPFTECNADIMGTPALHLSIKQLFGPTQYENCFNSFHCCFGRFRSHSQNGGPPTFEEDHQGWRGSADLFVACAVPTFGLLMGPRNGLKISLVVNTSPENLKLFVKKLGPLLIVFEASLDDERRVSITTDPLHLDTKSSMADQRKWLQSVSAQRDSSQAAFATFDARHQINKLQIRTMFANGREESKALADGAMVAVDPIDLFNIRLKIGNTSGKIVRFPFAIQSYSSKTRVARKSSWVEIEAAVYLAPQKDPFDTWTHATSLPDDSLALDYIPRVDMNIQPIMHSISQTDRTWLNLVFGAMGVEKKQSQHLPDAKSDLKHSLSIMFGGFVGFHPALNAPIRNFTLNSKRTQEPHAFIYVKNLRHDLDLGSIILDAYVMPLTMARFGALGPANQNIIQHFYSSQTLSVEVDDNELILWKRLLPVLAERCRTWKHKDTCEYRKEGKIPLSIEEDENPLCSCGEGIVPPAFTENNAEWEPMARYVTRIAISPVFPVPYVETTAGMYDNLPPARSAPQSDTQPGNQGPRCDNCNKSSVELKNCAACGKAKYCSKECQKTAWKSHKLGCKK
ncbi:MAG: hypothetical protein Q9207_006480 [Kuettlingeria erythrocarpa]